jgi:hypothetical protein
MANNGQTLILLECSIQKCHYNLRRKAAGNEIWGMLCSQSNSFLSLHKQQDKNKRARWIFTETVKRTHTSDETALKKTHSDLFYTKIFKSTDIHVLTPECMSCLTAMQNECLLFLSFLWSFFTNNEISSILQYLAMLAPLFFTMTDRPTNQPTNQPTNFVALVREWTIPTEWPPLVGEVSANFCG